MARIYLDASCMSADESGVNRYCSGLVPALVAAAPQHEFIVLRSADTGTAPPPLTASAQEVVVRRHGSDWRTLAAAPAMARVFRRFGRPDVFHSLFHLLPMGLRRGRLAPRLVVVTLHDLIWLDHAYQIQRNWLAAEWLRRVGGAAIRSALRSADRVICVSDATSTRAAAWADADRRITIHHGLADSWFVPVPRSSESNDGRPYIAAFGVPKAYKNIRLLVRAFAQVRQEFQSRLILIGGDGGAAGEIRSANIGRGVTVANSLSDDDLRSVISGARMLIVPSLAEGFGLPVLEAMALGTPVVISDIAALREVAGDAALVTDPADAAQLARTILRVLSDDALHGELAARGRARAAAFRWPRAAKQTLAVYDALLSRIATPYP